MKLLSAKVRNYRIHREIQVDFDSSGVTIIGGPNETGKSTLIEAIHRGLFLKSTITGRIKKEMKCRFAPSSHPEVTVEFEAKGKSCRVTKIFKGQQGVTILEVDGKSLHGKEAEERLAGLLEEDVCKGKGGSDAKRRWSHIWVWQGKSGEDVSRDLEDMNDRLIKRLQQAGGGIVQQTELDARIARIFQEKMNDIFTKQGKPKKNSRLLQLQEELNLLEEEFNEAKSRVESLEKARSTFLKAVKDIKDYEIALNKQEKEKGDVKKKLDQANRLLEEYEKVKQRMEELQENRENLKKLDTQIKELNKAHEKLKKELIQAEDKVKDTETRLERLSRDQEDLSKEIAEVRRQLSLLGKVRSWAESWIRFFELKEQLDDFREKKKRMDDYERELTNVMSQMADLPEIDVKLKTRIDEVAMGLRDAEVALKAMAAGIEVVEAKKPVLLNGERLEPGTSRIVTDHAKVSIGDGTVLLIKPGGGPALKEAMEKASEARTTLDKLLQEARVSSPEEALKVFERLKELKSIRKGLEDRIKELGGDSLSRRISQLEYEIDSKKREIEMFKRDGAIERLDPGSKEEAKEFLEEFERKLHELEGEEGLLAGRIEEMKKTEKEMEELRRLAERDRVKILNELTAIKAQREAKEEQAGDEEKRKTRLAELANELAMFNQDLDQLQEQIRVLQPDILSDTLKRLERATDKLNGMLQKAREEKAGASAILKQDGAIDPVRRLKEAEARLDMARERFEAEERWTSAIRLVHTLFQEEQRRFSDRYSAPLAEKINQYIWCIFGGTAEVKPAFLEGRFTGIHFRHANNTPEFDYSSLSGGTREQVAAAVRLAVAELLAQDHDGHLPVVFDDAFTNTDPERQKAVLTMLFKAVKQGLQPIVLTSNPMEYIGLGARVKELERPKIVLDSGALAESDGGKVFNGQAGQVHEIVSSHFRPDSDYTNDFEEEKRQFLKTLERLGKSAGNSALRQALGWDEGRYNLVKDQLVFAGKVKTARGRGGSVKLID